MGTDVELETQHDAHLLGRKLPEKRGYIFSYYRIPACSPLPGTE